VAIWYSAINKEGTRRLPFFIKKHRSHPVCVDILPGAAFSYYRMVGAGMSLETHMVWKAPESARNNTLLHHQPGQSSIAVYGSSCDANF